jgi:hypothetical protein
MIISGLPGHRAPVPARAQQRRRKGEPHEEIKENGMRKFLAASAALLTGLALASAITITAAPAAQASALTLCNESSPTSYCWVNEGVNEEVSTTSSEGSAWNWVPTSSGAIEVVTGSGTCAWDGGRGTYVKVENTCPSDSLQELYLEVPENDGAYMLLSQYATKTLSTDECLIRESNGGIGNFNCTDDLGSPPASADWVLA